MDDKELQKALEFHRKNQFKKAIKSYIDLLKNESNNNISFLLGTAYLQKKDYVKSIEIFHQILKIDPSNYHAYSNLALAYMEQNDDENSEIYFKKSIQLNKNFTHSYNNLGNLYLKQLKHKEAIECYSKAINIKPEISFFLNRSICYLKINEIALSKADLINFGNIYDNEKAFFHYIDILKSEKNYSEILKSINLALNKFDIEKINKIKIDARINLDLTDDLLASINKIKNNYDKNFYLGLYYYKINSNEKSKFYFYEALKENSNSPNLYNNLGLIYRDAGDYDEAKNLFEKALSVNINFNEAKTNLGLIYLHNLDFRKGWDFYYFRNKDNSILLDNNIKEISDINNKNKILVINEQGLGDQLIYLQILKKIKDSHKFYFIVDHRLYDLLKKFYPNFNFIKNISIKFDSFEDFIFLADLQKYYISSPDELNQTTPLFPMPVGYRNQNNKINCGIAWKSPNSNYQSKFYKSLNLLNIIEAVEINDLQYTNLQYGNVNDDIQLVKNNLDIDILIESGLDYFNDINSLLYLISKLDFVITTSNVTAHLAGAIGKKTYLLVPELAGRIWYWHNTESSLWYPNTKQFFYNQTNFKKILKNLSNQIRNDFLIN